MTTVMTTWATRLSTSLLTIALLAACHETPTTTITGVGKIGQDSLALACEADRTCPGGGTCDPATLRCVICSSDADCASGYCDADAHVCVQCVDDSDCERGVCHPTRNVCVGCWQDDDCGASLAAGGGGVCHPELLSCVECFADGDCASGRCNRETFGCVGGCERDAQCDDNDPCTRDMCGDGACAYAEVADCGCAPVDFVCPRGSEPTDSNDDRCLDACVCEAGQVIRPGGTCPCPAAPVCPSGTRPVDRDQDGCADACECSNGAIAAADGSCPCPATIACDGGLVASDLDGDGCPETCTKPCASDCDCEAQGLVADVPCPLACAQCGPFLVCDGGVCAGRCGVDDGEPCKCPAPPVCSALQTAIDKDLDGCNDSCECLVPPDPSAPADPAGTVRCGCPLQIACEPGALPTDTDRDGCPDTCVCANTGRAPRPDGSCCDPLVCPLGATALDTRGDGCPDVCRCGDGTNASDIAPACACLQEKDCDGGSKPVDTNNDACADVCECADGELRGPNGCTTCLASCDDVQARAANAYYVDEDKDGCYDLVDSCPVGSYAASTPNAGCPDTCAACAIDLVCPARAIAFDSDGDNCADACRCADGGDAPADGCKCPSEIACEAPGTAIDRDLDGCTDSCAVPCSNACDCVEAGKSASFAPPACDARVAGSCVEGFCAFACAANALVAACPVSPEPAPVCGCDDVSYSSACDADQAGVAVKRAGACETGGCATDSDCKETELCELPTGVCTVAGPSETPVAARGECQPIPASCLGSDAQVCGCDQKTYMNDCERRKARVARATDGPCAPR